MKLIPCRDCGAPIDPEGRGCRVCARNLEAERMLTRVLMWATLVIVLATILSAVLYFKFVKG